MAELEKTKHQDTSTQCTIDRFEGEMAVLLTQESENNEIFIPKKYLPIGAAEGMVIILTVQNAQEAEVRREQSAKDILNELFGEKPQ